MYYILIGHVVPFPCEKPPRANFFLLVASKSKDEDTRGATTRWAEFKLVRQAGTGNAW
jgi:hypothetical protein